MMRLANRLQTSKNSLSPMRRTSAAAAAAAAFSTVFLLNHPTQAFVVGGGASKRQAQGSGISTTGTARRPPSSPALFTPIHLKQETRPVTSSTNTRLFSSFRRRDDDNNDNDNGGGFLEKLGKVAKSTAKSILPSSWFQSEKEQKAAIERKRVKNQLSTDMKDMLKGAPLPVRVMGGMIAPIISNVMSGLAETMAEQQEVMDEIMQNARSCLVNDPAVANAIGSGAIQMDAPFSQSSSTTSINGQTLTRVELAFSVSGSRGSGVVRMTAQNNDIQQLILQTNDGRTISVNTKGGGGTGRQVRAGRNAQSSSSDDNIIEAEIIEKKDTKP